MRTRFLLTLPLCLAVAATAAVFEEPTTPKSADAREAKARYEQAVTAARKQYLADLDEAIKKATQAGELDDAVKIRGLKESVEAAPAQARVGALTFRGSQYRIFLADVKWGEARKMCQALGGDLVSIDSKEKREFLGKHAGSVELWVGAFRDARRRQWVWANGSAIAPESWSPGRPENHGPVAVIFGKSGLLGDARDDHKGSKGFICEWKR
jgi:hypothetical protein